MSLERTTLLLATGQDQERFAHIVSNVFPSRIRYYKYFGHIGEYLRIPKSRADLIFVQEPFETFNQFSGVKLHLDGFRDQGNFVSTVSVGNYENLQLTSLRGDLLVPTTFTDNQIKCVIAKALLIHHENTGILSEQEIYLYHELSDWIELG